MYLKQYYIFKKGTVINLYLTFCCCHVVWYFY